MVSRGARVLRSAPATARDPVFDVVFYMPLIGTILARSEGQSPAGGAERQMLMLAARLAQRGWLVGVASNSVAQALPATIDGVHLLVHQPFGGDGRQVARLASLREMIWMLASLDARVLVQRSAGTTTGYVALAARLRRRRFVYSSANVIDFSFERLEPSRRAVRLFHLGVRLAQAIVVQTPEQVELCQERFGREPTMIKSLAEPQPLRDGEAEAFLWVGRLAHYKRPEVFLELAKAMPEARFWMVAVATGTAEERSLAKLRAASASLANFELLAPRPREELGELIARSVAVVNTADYEGMPNVFLEGWARGVPALALSHDPDGVIQRERVGAFARGSQDLFAELARAMWSERERQADVATRCRDYLSREHSIEAVVDRWESVLGLRSGGA